MEEKEDEELKGEERGEEKDESNSDNRISSPHVVVARHPDDFNDDDCDDAVGEEFEKMQTISSSSSPQKTKTKKNNPDDDENKCDDESNVLAILAERKRYKWAKVKGSPFWPCQEVDVLRCKGNVPEFVREKVDGFLEAKGVKLIQFFGTNEYMWYLEKSDENASSGPPRSGSMFRRVDVESFRDGCEKGYDKKMKTVGLKKAVKEMWECLRSGEDPSDVKRGGLQWHTKKIAVVEEEEPEEEEEKAKKTEKKKASSTGKRKKAEAKKTSAAEEKEMKKAKKISEEVKRREEKTAAAAAAKMELDARKEQERKRNEPATLETLFDDEGIEEKAFQLSFDVMSARDPPPFERLRRNRWMCRQAPKQVHSSEAVACYCQPIPHSIKEEMMANVTTERAMKMASTASAAEVEQQFIEENGPATPPETLEDPLNNNNNNNNSNEEKGKKSLTAKPLPKLRLGCGHDCVNRETRYTCDTRVCPCGGDCSNRPFQHLPQPKVKVQLTENRGYGLFLQQDVFEGDFIVEYMGEIVDEEECTRRLLACKGKNEPNFYLMEITPSQIIDARFCGNNARFINSSCHPNCETQRWVDASTNETRVGIFATEDIKSGTELTYDYNFAHFGGEGTTSFTCFCGHPMCKGTLDANPERMRRFMDRVTVTMKNGDVKTGTVLEYTVNKKYKLLLDDEQDAKVWSKSKKSEEEKAESALKKTKNRKYITVNLDNGDFASKKGGKKDAKLACVWLTNRTNFTESKVKKKKVDEKKKSATTTKIKAAGKRKRPRAATKKLKEQEQEQEQEQELEQKTPTTPLKEIVLSPVKRLVENAIANVVKYIY
ncbi:unnamed protein product [Bathycoccus prasinos]